jgi:hypothetical protein
MLSETGDKLLRPKIKRLANPKQREPREWRPCFNHLPVANTESARVHIFLAQLSFRS